MYPILCHYNMAQAGVLPLFFPVRKFLQLPVQDPMGSLARPSYRVYVLRMLASVVLDQLINGVLYLLSYVLDLLVHYDPLIGGDILQLQ